MDNVEKDKSSVKHTNPAEKDEQDIRREIVRFLKVLGRPEETREVRIFKYDKYNNTASGYYNWPESLANDVVEDWLNVSNSFVSLNPVNPALLARANNRIEPKAKHATTAGDVIVRRWLPVDIDPERPADISSTDEEQDAAFEVLDNVTAWLREGGCGEVVTAASGNGAYALVPIDLPNTPESTALVKGVLETLAAKFDTDAAHIDTSVHDPNRVIALIGTKKMKGDNMPERPWRWSRLINVPDCLEPVPEALLAALVPEKPLHSRTTNGAKATASVRTGKKTGRNVNLASVGGLMVRNGIEPAVVETALHAMNGAVYGDNPLPGGEIEQVARSMERYRQADEPHGTALREFYQKLDEVQQATDREEALGNLRGVIRRFGITRILAEQLEEDESFASGPKTPNNDRGLYVYQGGVYRPDDGMMVARAVKVLLEEWDCSGYWKRTTAADVASYLVAGSSKLRTEPPTDEVCLLDCLFNVIKGEQHPHTPEWLWTVQLPIRFDPLAECPENDAFMKAVYTTDAYEAGVPWELEAQSMLPTTGFAKADLFLGIPGTGKTTRLLRLENFVGKDNASAESFHKLEEDRFRFANLQGKLVNIAPDMSKQPVKSTENFVAYAGGDAQSPEAKFVQPGKAPKTANLVLQANQPPQVRSADDAFFDRLRVHPFDKKHRGTKHDIPQEELLALLSTPEELSGVFNKAVKAAKHIREHGLTETQSMKDALENMRGRLNPTAPWFIANVVVKADALVPQGILRDLYNKDAKANGRVEMDQTPFGRAVKRRYPNVQQVQRTINGKKGVWCYLGIGLRARKSLSPKEESE